MNEDVLVRRYRLVMGLFIVGLILSGITAFPLLFEMRWVAHWAGDGSGGLQTWLRKVHLGLEDTYSRHPWLAYGTDWLAFAHLAIAVFFIGPWMHPRHHSSTLIAGLIACAGVVPLAMICGEIRGIPFGWRLIDCSFGVGGAIPLGYCLHLTRRMRREGVDEGRRSKL